MADETIRNLDIQVNVKGADQAKKTLRSITDATEQIGKAAEEAANRSDGAVKRAKAMVADLNKREKSYASHLSRSKGLQNYVDQSMRGNGMSRAQWREALGLSERTPAWQTALDARHTPVDGGLQRSIDAQFESQYFGPSARSAASAFAELFEEEDRQAKEAADALKEQERVAKEALKAEEEAQKKAAKAAEEHAKKVREVTKAFGKAVLATGGKALQTLTSPFKKLGESVSGIGKKISSFVSAIGRIALYRALRTAIKEITAGFSEGVKNMYAWAEASDSVFKGSMDSLATSALYLKNSFAAMAAPLINALAPALDLIVEKAVAMMNVIGQALAKLTGTGFYYEATKSAKEYGEAAGGAAKAAKAQLEAFDELNNITTNKGGGGGSADADAGGVFKKFETDGMKVSLAEMINGWVDTISEMELGKKLADKINKGLVKARNFLRDVEWGDLGGTIGSFIHDSLAGIDPLVLGLTISSLINSAVDMGLEFLKKLQAGDIGTNFGKTLSTILTTTNWENVGKFFKNLATTIGTFLKNAFKGVKASDVIGAIGDFFRGLGWEGALLLSLPTLMSAATGLVKVAFTALQMSTSLSGVGTALLGYGLTIVKGIATGIMSFLGIDALWTGIKGLWAAITGDNGKAQELYEQVRNSKNPITRAIGWIADMVDKALFRSGETIDEYEGNLMESATETGDAIGQIASDTGKISEGLSNAYKDSSPIFAGFNSAFQNFKDMADDATKSKIVVNAVLATGVNQTANFINNLFDRVNATWKIQVTATTTPLFDDTEARLAKMMKKTDSLMSSYSTTDLKRNFYSTPPLYANGGFPQQGTYFLAGETIGETEMVGNINGKTGVASGKEITGIATAVYSTGASEEALLREQNGLLRALLKKDLTISPSAGLGGVISQSGAMYNKVTGA